MPVGITLCSLAPTAASLGSCHEVGPPGDQSPASVGEPTPHSRSLPCGALRALWEEEGTVTGT